MWALLRSWERPGKQSQGISALPLSLCNSIFQGQTGLLCFHLPKKEWWKVKAYLSSSKLPAASPWVNVWLQLLRSQPRAPVSLNALPVSPVMCYFNTGHTLVSGWSVSWSSNPGFWPHLSLFGTLPRLAAGCLALRWMAPLLWGTGNQSFPKSENHHFYWLHADYEPGIFFVPYSNYMGLNLSPSLSRRRCNSEQVRPLLRSSRYFRTVVPNTVLST